MQIVKEIFNSEGPLLAIAKDRNEYYIMIKRWNFNEYAYFPLKKQLLKLYFEGEITVRELLPSYESFIFIDKYYQNVDQNNIAHSKDDILNSI